MAITVIKVAQENSPSTATLATDSPPVEVGVNGIAILSSSLAVDSPTIAIQTLNIPIVSYVHTQSTSLSVWAITHNLGWYPNITVQDSAGTTVEGDIIYTDLYSLIITFSGSFTGKAYLS